MKSKEARSVARFVTSLLVWSATIAATLTGCHGVDGLSVGGRVGDACGGNFVCAPPLQCNQGRCADPSAEDAGMIDAGEQHQDAGDDGRGGSGGFEGAGGAGGAGGSDPTGSGGVGGSKPTTGAGGADGGSVPPYVTPLSDYPSCDRDSDCQVGRGRCVTALELNRQSGGETSISIAELFPGRDQRGVCTETCTRGASSCSALTWKDASGVSIPYSCQLVYEVDSPYDASLELPFGVDELEMSAGVAFAALCRPPFPLEEDVSTALCGECSESSQCGAQGICWDFVEEREGTGSCLAACSADATCPAGFECTALDGADYCAPIQGTCGACRDLDDDGRGVGACDPDGLATPVDCDDRDPTRYFDPEQPTHAFPEYCGHFDYNCNGVVDSDEQIGADVFPEEHCGACDSPCAGELTTLVDGQSVVTAMAECRPTTAQDGPIAECAAKCEPGWADCDGLLENGCEASDTDTNYTYFFDGDDDGDGDPNMPRSFCEGMVEDGYVPSGNDCDDQDRLVSSYATELCDGKDNDCNGKIDDNAAVPTYPDGDGDGYGDASAVAEIACPSAERVTNNSDCDDTDFDVKPGADEICDGKDNDCNGQTDEGQAAPGTWYPDADEDGDGDSDTSLAVVACAQPPKTSATHGDCADDDPSVKSSATELCDGKDNNCNDNVDEGFSLGQACDGPDESDCADGVIACTADALSSECVEDVWKVRSPVDNICREQCRYFVKLNGSDGATGDSWDQAFATVQKGIDSAATNDCVVWVAKGTYLPTKRTGSSTDDRTKAIQLNQGVKLYGGFSGTERYLVERNLAVNETILSGDIGVDGESSDNAYHVVLLEDYDGNTTPLDTVLDGFTITKGYANGTGSHQSVGAGLAIEGPTSGSKVAAPAIDNCRFKANQASGGGAAVYMNASNPTFSKTSFVENIIAAGSSASVGRGAVYLNNSGATFESCDFDGNTTGNLQDAFGGAIYVTGSRNPGSGMLPVSIKACNLTKNASVRGGAIYTTSSAPPLVIENSTFSENAALYGALYLTSTNPTTLTGGSLANNVLGGTGGTIVVFNGTVTVTGTSFGTGECIQINSGSVKGDTSVVCP